MKINIRCYIYIYSCNKQNTISNICNNRLLLHEFYCNKLQIIDKNNLDQIILMIFSL